MLLTEIFIKLIAITLLIFPILCFFCIKKDLPNEPLKYMLLLVNTSLTFIGIITLISVFTIS